jgi:hypothetical protein
VLLSSEIISVLNPVILHSEIMSVLILLYFIHKLLLFLMSDILQKFYIFLIQCYFLQISVLNPMFLMIYRVTFLLVMK